MTDAYDELRKDWCDAGDMPRATCYHCGARPGGPALPPLDRPWSFDGQRMKSRSGRDVFPSLPTPTEKGIPLRLRHHDGGTCGCGQPTRDNAYGCDVCSGELERLLSEAPWIAEQLEATITKQRAAGAPKGTDPESLPWNDKASRTLNALVGHLAGTVKLCVAQHVRNQSPYAGMPDANVAAMSRWLLWRVDGLALNQAFTDTLKVAARIAEDALKAIDRGPDLMYLGLCDARDEDGLCGGAIYARTGETTGKCRACRAVYDVDIRRGGLEKALDDRLCTASEIAHLATYLGLPASATRAKVRNLVNQWYRRKVIAGHVTREHPEPRFRYGDVAPRLAATYADKGA